MESIHRKYTYKNTDYHIISYYIILYYIVIRATDRGTSEPVGITTFLL